ncbi:urea ABC transporter permease subunit UrtC [Lichenicoccus sp.]|uniref:urea ABC transporter permease subunit UrtC n=1 Tax=Lichenicoccus sp. TaxID=2781899 RepID=UPI003D0E1D14
MSRRFDVPAILTMLVLGLLAVALPALALTATLPTYPVNLIGQLMCFALLAMAVDLLWGGAGILSLGHGLFFALGGYLCAMHLLRTAHAATHVLPDFLLYMGAAGFPSWWGFADSAALTVFAILLVPAAAAFLFGFVSFRSRVNGVYFSIITQALTYTAMLLMFRNDTGFGGNNGMTGFHDLAGLPLGGPTATVALATASILAVLACLVAGRFVLGSRLGRLLAAVRDDEPRLRFLGYETLWLKLAVWCASASLAAVAGALYVPQVGIVNPALLDPALSLEVAVWVAIGGRGGLCGAILGATLVTLLKAWLSASAPLLWPFVLGLLILLVVMALPNGLLDIGNRSRAWMTRLGRAA